MNKEILINGLEEMDISYTQEQINKLETYYNSLIEANKTVNLTSISDDEIITKHFLDSYLGAAFIKPAENKVLLDIGTGAGFPGLPLKILFNELNVTLLDSTQKKINYLKSTINDLRLENIEAIKERAETLAHETNYRAKYDYIVTRAVASLPVLLELGLPFLVKGGSLIIYKGPNYQVELDKSKSALKLLGGDIEQIISREIPYEKSIRNLIIIRKKEDTSEKYPRRPGMPAKRPLN